MLLDDIQESFGRLDIDHGIDSESTPEDIETLQKYLMFLDYDLPRFGADGDYGGETISAIEAYQQDNGLEITGIADTSTLQHMATKINEMGSSIDFAEMKLRNELVESAMSYVGTLETDGNNRSPQIAEFLRADKYSDSLSSNSSLAAPLGSAWCAGFASYVLDAIDPQIIDYNVLAKGIMRQFDKNGAFYDVNSEYTPEPGDMIFFERGAFGDWRGHVGFVVEVKEDGTIVTVEGNKEHPDLEEETGRAYDPERPDGVRLVEYSPDEFEQERILGFGNTMEMYSTQVGLDYAINMSMVDKNPQLNNDPNSEFSVPLIIPNF